jgi:translocation and assembly module TamB
VLVALLVLAAAWLHTGLGRQWVVGRIASYAPASGLSVEVGRIEGSVLWSATLRDVKLRDAKGRLFLEVPVVDLNWRPLKFFFTGLDVRHLVLHRGTLYARPELLPGDPEAPILPDFDIRVDRLVVDDLKVARGLLGDERMVDFRARADVRDGRVLLDASGALGGGDTLKALVDAYPDGNRFDLDLDYRAPAGGLLATLTGAEADSRARIVGDGTWRAWDGSFLVTQGGVHIAAFKLRNRRGTYSIVGQARPEGYLTGLPAAALGKVVSLAAVGTLENSAVAGTFALRGRGVTLDAEGAANLNDNTFDSMKARVVLLDSELFGPGASFRDAVARATFDGPFRRVTAPIELTVREMDLGGTVFTGFAERGTVSYDGARWTLPLDATVERITSGNALIDPRLVRGTLRGLLVLADERLTSDNLSLRFPGLAANLTPARRHHPRRLCARRPGRGARAGAREPRHRRRRGQDPVQDRQRRAVDAAGELQRSHAAGDQRHAGQLSPAATSASTAGCCSARAGRSRSTARGSPRASSAWRSTAGSRTGAPRWPAAGGTSTTGRSRSRRRLPMTGRARRWCSPIPIPRRAARRARRARADADGFRIETEGQSTLGPVRRARQPDDARERTDPAHDPAARRVADHGHRRADSRRWRRCGNLAAGGRRARRHDRPRPARRRAGVRHRAHRRKRELRRDDPAGDQRGHDRRPRHVRRGQLDVNGSARGAGISYGTLFIGRFAGPCRGHRWPGHVPGLAHRARGTRFALQLAGDAHARSHRGRRAR